MTDRMLLKAIVAAYLSNDMQPVDGPNEGREFTDHDYISAVEAINELIHEEYLNAESIESANGDSSLRFIDYGVSSVTPTAKGIFEALT